MPELPDIVAYLRALEPRVVGERLERVRLASPFFLRTFDPPVAEVEGRRVADLRRMGKRIVFALEGGIFLVVHLMIAGRLRWRAASATTSGTSRLAGRNVLAALDFPTGSLVVTEASPKKRASLHVVRGEESLRALDPGGLEVIDATLEEFRAALLRESHTLKRALTDPHLFSGIGNAYSDEILHRARLSPVRLTRKLTDDEVERLFAATREALGEWVARLLGEAEKRFPEKVTAFRPEMTVHGRFGKPCPACGAPIQRIVYAENEANYCAVCQTGGRLLADRALSQLMRSDWPRTLEELEERKQSVRSAGEPAPSRGGVGRRRNR